MATAATSTRRCISSPPDRGRGAAKATTPGRPTTCGSPQVRCTTADPRGDPSRPGHLPAMPHIRLTIGRKLALAFGAVVVLMLVPLSAAMTGTANLRDSTKRVGQRAVPTTRLLGEATTEIRQFRVAQLERTLA